MFLVTRATDEQLVMQRNAQNGTIRVQLLSADFQMVHPIINEQIFILCHSSRCYQKTVRPVSDSRVNDLSLACPGTRNARIQPIDAQLS